MATKKLIEVALPLDKINAECAREKSIRHGHPSTLHLWWARRPLAAARAVIWSSLVDDPSSHPEKFPTEEAQNKERQRLFSILEKLVVWENANDPNVLEAAKAEIMKSTNGNPPALLDPFAGGGTIPLEAQRLGLEAHAHDLNPVALMINKAMLEIPARFSDQAAVNVNARAQFDNHIASSGANGLADDVEYYGKLVKDETFHNTKYMYPDVQMPASKGGGRATPIAWIWARTVKCSNPVCGCKIPLASSLILSKKKGNETWIKPIVHDNEVQFEVVEGKCPKEFETLKVGRSATFKCPCCGEVTTDSYVKEQGKKGGLGQQLIAVVCKGKHGRVYVAPDEEQIIAANAEKPEVFPDGEMPQNPRWFSPPSFGMYSYSDLFTNRQLTFLTKLSESVNKIKKIVEKDAVHAGMPDDHIPLCEGGSGARAYGEAVGVYLAFSVDKMVDYNCTICIWHTTRELIANAMRRQAIQMTWDFAETNPISGLSGSFDNMVTWITKCLRNLPASGTPDVRQFDAQSDCGLRNIMISTDPPYYDNIGYADLSDFFYIWMRQSLKDTYPKLFRTMLVPKAEELVATPYRFNGSMAKAKSFFESGMLSTCCQLYKYSKDDLPVTIYYAYKQSETDISDDRTTIASTGWETMLSSIIEANFAITGTWPMRTELTTALKGNVNALASSIVLVCRKRPENAPQTTRRNLVNALRKELRPALKKLQESNIAPVDLAQSAIGPGMGVFSRFRRVLEADGSEMSVRSALQIINEEIDLYFNEQVGCMDTASRFCVDLYTQSAYNDIQYGVAEVLANAKGASIPQMAADGVLYAKAGNVHLVERNELPVKVDVHEDNIWLLTQQLTRAIAKGGIKDCAEIVFSLFGSNAENAKDLAYRLYTIAERKGWTDEAYAYNTLVVAWPDIQSRAAEMKADVPEQLDLFSE